MAHHHVALFWQYPRNTLVVCAAIILQKYTSNFISTVEPPIVHGSSEIGTLHVYNRPLYTKDTAQGPKKYSSYSFNMLRTSKREQPLYKGQNR